MVAGLCCYFLPTIIAIVRGHHNQNAIAVLNTCLGWTLVGWVASLVWALTVVSKVE
ncbi:superinfection immunity protein [Burkholderia sp. AU31624]|uniref:superinfection immunity protein n=1 Tax=Burkholderia sp. AU31624 TaxID=2879629 RepID=UPI001CF34594|nr:superinfection immunity protein [Burkholderia sp. AU31624]MCA8255863.1 superinfection immunity protein [Burkholderia sp. AU31624]